MCEKMSRLPSPHLVEKYLKDIQNYKRNMTINLRLADTTYKHIHRESVFPNSAILWLITKFERS